MSIITRTIEVFLSVPADTSLSALPDVWPSLFTIDPSSFGYTVLCKKAVEFSFDTSGFVSSAVEALNAQETTLRADFQSDLEKLQATRASLLALTVEPEVRASVDPAPSVASDFLPFYVTYSTCSVQRSNFSVVYALSYDNAREFIGSAIGDEFAFCYNAKDFEGQAERYNLTQIPLTAQVLIAEQAQLSDD